ncbi:unnamed protein product [Brachionus calyciflorus]|uniref:Uncharacterized protein n=1 Tax=Brachionus calyciflorus TaxID=104777 RepID=A0A814FUM2_9BILA|nr:unnamed protein product [Brachionus calyciflorus]
MNIENFKNLNLNCDYESPLRLRNRNIKRNLDSKIKNNFDKATEISQHNSSDRGNLVDQTQLVSESTYTSLTEDEKELNLSINVDECELDENDLSQKTILMTKTTKGKPLLIFDKNEFIL